MVTIVRMGMIMYLAGAVIVDMCDHDQEYGRNQQPVVVFEEKLFQHQEHEAGIEKRHGQQAVMVFPVTMPERIGADGKCQYDHSDLKPEVMYDIDPEEWQTAEEQGQEGTMNGTGQ